MPGLCLFLLAALLFAHVIQPSYAEDQPTADHEQELDLEKHDYENSGSTGGVEEGEDPSKSILETLAQFPGLGKQGAGLLQLAEEGLGINISKLELGKIVPLLIDLQKSVHDHYVVTKGKSKYQPSSLLKRVVSRKSQSKVIKSMKKIAPNTDDGELMQQLDAVTQLIHEMHTNPENTVSEVLKSVSNAVGLDLEEEDMAQFNTHMKWAQDFVKKFLPFLPGSVSEKKAEEL